MCAVRLTVTGSSWQSAHCLPDRRFDLPHLLLHLFDTCRFLSESHKIMSPKSNSSQRTRQCVSNDTIPIAYKWCISANEFSGWFDGNKLRSPIFGTDDIKFRLHLDYNKDLNKDLLLLELVTTISNMPTINASGDKTVIEDISVYYKLSTYGNSATVDTPVKLNIGVPELLWKPDYIFPNADRTKDKMIRCELTVNKAVYIYGEAPVDWGSPMDHKQEEDSLVPSSSEKQSPKELTDSDEAVEDFSYGAIEDFSEMFKSGKFSDAQVHAGGKVFHVHRMLLSFRSSVFSDIFDEQKSGRVEITDMTADVVEQMLAFIYSGKVENLGQLAGELMIAAEKFKLDKLKAICEQHLTFNITAKSVCRTLIFADRNQDYNLRRKCIQFITENSADIKQANGWADLKDYPDLFIEIINSLTDFKK